MIPTSNIKGLMSMYQSLRTNPMSVLGQRFNIPTDVDTTDPNSIIQHLLNTGQVSQAQVNNAMAMRDNPFFMRLMGRNNNSF